MKKPSTKPTAAELMLLAADKPDASEHAIQAAFFVAIRHIDDPAIPFVFACPNGGERGQVVAAMMVKEGVKRGVPDVILPFPRGNHPFAVIEFKRPIHRTHADGGLSFDQLRYRDFMQGIGVLHAVCYTWREGYDFTQAYVNAHKY